VPWGRHLAGFGRALVGTLGETIQLSGGGSATVQGIYKRPFELDEASGSIMRGATHTVSLRNADVPGWLQRGSTMIVSSRTPAVELVVQDLVPDGQEMTEVRCHVGVAP
jgi:hypothetical protein